MGWIGDNDRVLEALTLVGADLDEGARFMIRGTIASFMGAGEEVVVGDETVYFKDGEPHSLPELLASRSGSLVHVIGG